MFIAAKLVFQNYIPDKLVPGMMFKQRVKDVVYGKIYEYDRIYMLATKPLDRETWIIANGYPVKPVIVSLTANPDDKADVLATAEQIGWWDDQPWNDDCDLRDIEVKDFNYILQEEDGYVDIEVDYVIDEDGVELFHPVLYMGQCVLRIVQDDDEYIIDDDDYEDMDDMDDLTDADHETE